jgi:hypothetical protein
MSAKEKVFLFGSYMPSIVTIVYNIVWVTILRQTKRFLIGSTPRTTVLSENAATEREQQTSGDVGYRSSRVIWSILPLSVTVLSSV